MTTSSIDGSQQSNPIIYKIGEFDRDRIKENNAVQNLFLDHIDEFLDNFENKKFSERVLVNKLHNFVIERVQEDPGLGITRKDIQNLCNQLLRTLVKN